MNDWFQPRRKQTNTFALNSYKNVGISYIMLRNQEILKIITQDKRVAIFVMRIRASMSMRTKMTRQLYAQAVLRQKTPQ